MAASFQTRRSQLINIFNIGKHQLFRTAVGNRTFRRESPSNSCVGVVRASARSSPGAQGCPRPYYGDGPSNSWTPAPDGPVPLKYSSSMRNMKTLFRDRLPPELPPRPNDMLFDFHRKFRISASRLHRSMTSEHKEPLTQLDDSKGHGYIVEVTSPYATGILSESKANGKL